MDVLNDEQHQVRQDGVQPELVDEQRPQVTHRLTLLEDRVGVGPQRQPARLSGSLLVGQLMPLVDADDGYAEADDENRRDQDVDPQRYARSIRGREEDDEQKRD